LIPRPLLRSEVKNALDAQWTRLQLGKTIKEVVPFLPLEPHHIRQVSYVKQRFSSRVDNSYPYHRTDNEAEGG